MHLLVNELYRLSYKFRRLLRHLPGETAGMLKIIVTLFGCGY